MTEQTLPDSPSQAMAATMASAVFVVPALLSFSSSPSPNHPRVFFWYRTLRQPFFKPPDALIPTVWIGIETALAAATYRLLRCAPSAARTRALGWMAWNVGMIGSWSRLFFRHQDLAVSTAAAATMIATGVAFVDQARQVDRAAAKAGVPFVVWVTFATVLTASIWRLNRRR